MAICSGGAQSERRREGEQTRARAERQPQLGGYNYEFVERPPKAFQCECPVCLLVLHEPYQTTCCGNIFCEVCVKRVQTDKKPCPTCNEVDFKVFADKRLKRSLNEYHVYCSHKGEVCKWVGELGELDRHHNLQPPLDKLLVGCQYIQRCYMGGHQSDECPKRPFACEHCKMYEATFEDVTQKHWAVCGFFPLSCPNKCEAVVHRQAMKQHVGQDCPLTIIECEFKAAGCEVSLPRRDMPSHISTSLSAHVSAAKLVYANSHFPGEDNSAF